MIYRIVMDTKKGEWVIEIARFTFLGIVSFWRRLHASNSPITPAATTRVISFTTYDDAYGYVNKVGLDRVYVYQKKIFSEEERQISIFSHSQ